MNLGDAWIVLYHHIIVVVVLSFTRLFSRVRTEDNYSLYNDFEDEISAQAAGDLKC